MGNPAKRKLPPLRYTPPAELVPVGYVEGGDAAGQKKKTKEIIDRLTVVSDQLLDRVMQLLEDPDTRARDIFYGYAVVHDKRQMLIDQLAIMEATGSGSIEAQKVIHAAAVFEEVAKRRQEEREKRYADQRAARREELARIPLAPEPEKADGARQPVPRQGGEGSAPVSHSHGWSRGPRT